MKKTSVLALILILLLAFTLTACNGAQGIQGEKGDKGDQGEQGVQGEQGEAGLDGNSIIKTEIIDGYLWITYSNDPTNPVNVGKVTENASLHNGSEGLEFYPLSDDSYAVSLGKAIYLEEIVLPATYNGKAVTRVVSSQSVFAIPNDYRTEIKNITIPDSIVAIDDYAFEFCVSIANIDIPNTVTSIGERSFYGCTALKSITIPSNVTTIENSAFANCESLEEVSLPKNLETIEDYAFQNCVALKSIAFGDNISTVGAGAFSNCSALTEVHIPSLDKWLSINFTIDSLSIHTNEYSNPLYYAKDLFINGTKLTDLVIPDGTKTINDVAFIGCSIESISIPSSIETIGKLAFYSCDNLDKVYIDDLASWCRVNFSATSGIGVGMGVSYISNPLFTARDLYLNNTLVTELIIPDSVTKINDFAFVGASISKVVIPKSVAEIGRSAFYSNENLTHVLYCGTAEEWSAVTLGSSNSSINTNKLYFYSDTDVGTGNYWCYDNGDIKIWN